jgi:hypothetical protein
MSRPTSFVAFALSTLAAFALGCTGPGAVADDEGDLPVGDLGAEDLKADGNWGAATTCKPIPDLPRLSNPKIVVSLHGLTLRLYDETSGFDRVFPIGAGVIDQTATEPTFGESKSYYPIIATGKQDFAITPASITPCKIWWTDPDTGEKSPVFAGLPFLSWYGSYAMHGPVDNYRAQNGGNLRRGFVSHGCLRMEAADVLELYARIKGVARVPVHVQREPERDAAGQHVDVASRWIGAECQADADCSFSGGFCRQNKYSQRGFCSARCTAYCSDRPGYPTTFCVADPDAPTKGMCVAKVTDVNRDCRPYDHLVPVSRPRFSQPGVSATVCLPGSPGWVGDHCFTDTECKAGNRCAGATAQASGLCTQACTRYCPDLPGWADTTCVNEPDLGGPICVRQCTPAYHASECPAGTECVSRPWMADGSKTRNVCVP